MTLPTAPETLVSSMRGVFEEEEGSRVEEEEEVEYKVVPSSSCSLRNMNFFLAGSPSSVSWNIFICVE